MRRIAVALGGFCVFMNLYAPQSVLPLMAKEFGKGAGELSLAITASTLAVAMIAPFTGAVADVLGRKRVIVAAMFALIVPTVMAGLSGSLDMLVLWRFIVGLALPPVFGVLVAYIGEEWPPREAIAVTGLYTSATAVGGFTGRLMTGIIADILDWHAAFLALGAVTLLLAAGVAALLPAERHFVRSEGLRASARQMLRHFRNPQLVATYAVGFGVLFTFIASFTYVNFHLAAPPYGLSAALLGSIFVVYLAGSAVAPLAGRAVYAFGRRRLIVAAVAMWIGGLALTLTAPLPLIILGLAITTVCGFMCQAVSTSYVALSTKEGVSSAIGLSVTSYYVGGSVGGVLPGLVWNQAGWPGCVAMVIVVQMLIAAVVWRFWDEPAP